MTHPTPCSVGTGAPPGFNWPGHNVSHSTPSIAKVKNERIYTSTPSICLHGVKRENFTVTFIAIHVMG